MAFTVQDRHGSVADANAYISVDEFKVYHSDRGQPFASYDDAAIEQAIVKATDYLDTRFKYVGEVLRSDQPTEWPRVGATDNRGVHVNGIPTAVKEATAEYALRALSGPINPDPTRDDSGAVVAEKHEKVGPLEESVKYAAGGSFRMPVYPIADQKLRKAGFVRSGFDIARG